MNRACSTNEREEKCMWDIGGEFRVKGATMKTKT
jgi:hypothetical protein